MVVDTLVLSAIYAFMSAGIFAYVAVQVAPRRLGHDADVALALFATWWLGVAFYTGLTGVGTFLASVSSLDMVSFRFLTHVNILLICVALWGLLYYVLYLYTGSRRLLVPLTAFYLLVFLFLVYYITESRAIGFETSRWEVVMVYERPLEGPLFVGVLALLLLPQILACLALFALVFRTRDQTQRYRVTLVASSLVIWFGTAFVGTASAWATFDWWQLVSRTIGVAASLVTLLAYRPPQWVRRRYGVRFIGSAPE